jgi:glycine/D-amino acid oxidase-like deaminating enzyme
MDLSSGLPFWLIKSGLPYDYADLCKDEKADVAILGGGISGALAAWYLAKEGVSCIVVDRRTIGLGSTCASTAMLQYEIDTPLHELQHKVGLQNAVKSYKLCYEAIHSLIGIAKKIKFTDIERRESLYYSASKKDVSFIEREYAIRSQHGFDVSLLDESLVMEYAGISSPAAILSKQGAQTNAYLYTHSLLQDAAKHGAKIFDRTPIKKIAHQKKEVLLTSENGYTIKAKTLVYANGYEAVNYIGQKIVDLHSTYALCSEQGNAGDAPFKNKCILWNTADPYLYMRTTSDNRILIGGRDEKFYNPTKRDKLLDKKTRLLSNDFKKLYPDVEFKPEFSWCGTFGATKDGLPYIGPYKKLANSFFALGFGGNGITFSLIAAEILKYTITGKKHSAEKLFAFDR